MSPKLSDSLRGMADRAPVGEVSVSAPDAIKRVRNRRALRVTANGMVGAGAAAVLAFAVILPSTGGGTEEPGSALAAPESAKDGGADATLEADSRFGFGFCGGGVATQAEGQPGTLTVDGVGEDAVEGGSVAAYDVTLTATNAIDGAIGAPAVYVLWDGIVVATGYGVSAEAAASNIGAGESVATPVEVPLVNCWDGNSLPGGTYQVVASQDVFTASEEEPITPDEPAPLVDPAVDPVEPVEPATEPMEPGDGDTTASDAMITFDAGFSFISEPVTLTISGDVPEDPFGQYLNPVVPELPENHFSPELAREMYAAGLTGAWDMAKGTQRVLMTNDSTVSTNELWEDNYYGCSWDGGSPKTFPGQSSELSLLDVAGEIPSRINVSYGWVIDDNPPVSLTVKNISEYALPQMYEPNASLLLVRDGKVVAEGYPTSLDRDGSYSEALYFEPGVALSGEYIWRDVNGCWTEEGSSPVAAGTYTVLNLQYLYISNYANGPVVAYEGEDYLSSTAPRADAGAGAGTSGSSGSAGSSEPQVDVPEDSKLAGLSVAEQPGDYVEFQVWTSLGTLTVTT